MIVVAKKLSVLQLFISRMPKMCAILQLVSAPLNPMTMTYMLPSLDIRKQDDRSINFHGYNLRRAQRGDLEQYVTKALKGMGFREFSITFNLAALKLI